MPSSNISSPPLIIFWFRRDLRLSDNIGLATALATGKTVLPLFIFDTDILKGLEDKDDARLSFIHQQLGELQQLLAQKGSGLVVKTGNPLRIWQALIQEYKVDAVYTNRDYEPYAKARDLEISALLQRHGIALHSFKDQVIFDQDEVLNNSGLPYKVYSQYRNKWLKQLVTEVYLKEAPHALQYDNFFQLSVVSLPGLQTLGFKPTSLDLPRQNVADTLLAGYDKTRDFPGLDATSRMGIHLRFGTISIRVLVKRALLLNQTYLGELIWREFYMMILDQFPQVTNRAFKPVFDAIPWRQAEEEFESWCNGFTGIPLVDAGMRQLNQTGFMHNRVRMVVASFLSRNLLIDWRWGEAYFARKLLDFELASNNGGWQWAAGTGVDAQPYFRVFNPLSQAKNWDKDQQYVRQWVPEIDTATYPKPMVDLSETRLRSIEIYRQTVKRN